MDKTICNFLATQPTLARAATNISDEHMDSIIALIEPPFEVTTQEDKELMILLYITSLLKWLHIEGENDEEIDSAKLLDLLGTVYDEMPQYRFSRFCE